MKSKACLIASTLFFTGYAFAGDGNAYTCLELTEGQVIIAQDFDCKILQHPARKQQYPDVKFLAEQSQPPPLIACVIGKAGGKLGAKPFTASSISGVISYFDPLFLSTGEMRLPFTAATILQIQFGKHQAELYLRDSSQLINPGPDSQANAAEELYVIGGTKVFNGAKGAIKINGPELTGADVTGTICIKVDKDISEL